MEKKKYNFPEVKLGQRGNLIGEDLKTEKGGDGEDAGH